MSLKLPSQSRGPRRLGAWCMEQKSHAEDAEEVGRRNPFSLWSLRALREDNQATTCGV